MSAFYVCSETANVYAGAVGVDRYVAGFESLEEAEKFVTAVNAHAALVQALRETLAILESRWAVDPTCANALAWREARIAEWRAALALAAPEPSPSMARPEGD